MKTPAPERFWVKVRVTPGCWEWTANKLRGYGQFMPANGVCITAHRYAYQQIVGPVPEGLDLDHICRNRSCVNPEHLEPVTRGENLRRGYAARPARSHCAQGHPFDEDNTFARSDGGRGCRTCRNTASRASKARARAASAARPAQPNESRTA